jgi:hypothetical protein
LPTQLLMTDPRWWHNQSRSLTHSSISETQTIRGDAKPNLLLQNQNLRPGFRESTSEAMLCLCNPVVKPAPSHFLAKCSINSPPCRIRIYTNAKVVLKVLYIEQLGLPTAYKTISADSEPTASIIGRLTAV